MSGHTYFVFENPGDGYRSHAAPVLVAKADPFEYGYEPDVWLKRPVTCRHIAEDEHGHKCDILEIVDKETGHVWMRLGTVDVDDYYPGFVAEWWPLAPGEHPVGA
jgi:hypothetical protein